MDNQRLNNKVKQRDFKLNALLEITAAINANLSVASLLEQYERVLREHLSIEKIILFAKEESWKCILRFGVQKGEIKEIISDDFFTQSKEISLTAGRSKESFDLAIPIVQNGQTIAYVLAGDNSEQEIRMSPVIKHMRFIQTIEHFGGCYSKPTAAGRKYSPGTYQERARTGSGNAGYSAAASSSEKQTL